MLAGALIFQLAVGRKDAAFAAPLGLSYVTFSGWGASAVLGG
jgi:hypothetical protein